MNARVRVRFLAGGLLALGLVLACLRADLTAQAQSSTTVIATITSGRAGVIAANPNTNRIYAAQEDLNRIAVIDGTTNGIVATVSTQGFHTGIAVNPVTNRIYVSQQFGNSVRVIDGTTNSASDLPVSGSPGALAVNAATNRLYVVRTNNNDVAVFDAGTNTSLGAIAVSSPIGIAVNPVTNRIYVVSYLGASVAGSVSVFDGADNTLLGTVTIGIAPRMASVNTDTNRIYVTNYGENTVAVLDGASNAVIATIPVGANPVGIGVFPDNNRIYTGNNGNNTVSVIDGVTNTVAETVAVGSPVGGGASGIAVLPSLNQIYVSNDGGGYVSVLKHPATVPPPLPSGFYGEIRISANPPAIGSQVLAYVPGVVDPVGSATIQSQGNLVYSLGVRGDDTTTTVKDGGVATDPITFTLGGRVVATALWVGGTNVNLHIHPPDPVVTTSSPAHEGAAVTIDASSSLDWGNDIVSYAFDCDNNGAYELGPQATAIASCTFADGPSSQLVGVRIVDAQGGVGTTTTAISVQNVPPTATFNAPAAVDEGSSINLSLSAPADVAADLPDLSYAFDCGSGYGAFGPATSLSCTTSVTGSITVKGKLQDKDGGVSEYTASVTVNDVKPLSNAGGPYNGTAGQAVTLVGTPTCVSVDACTVEWFYNSTSLGKTNTVTHTWNTVGSHTVSFRVTDDDGNAVDASATVTITPATHAITLYPGWNLVSFNLNPTNTSVAAVLATVNGRYDLVYAWDASNQGWLKADNVPSSPDTLAMLTEKTGFWIHIVGGSAVTLSVEGSIPTTSAIALAATGQGWNLVGYPAAVSRALPGALQDNGVGTNFALVYSYRANQPLDQWQLFDRTAPNWANDLAGLDPGWGYWVKASANTTWNVSHE